MSTKSIIGILAIIALFAIASNSVHADDLTNEQIIARTKDTYASLTSYRDEGKTRIVDGDETTSITFKIKLARPNLYRIEWANDHPNAAFPHSSAKIMRSDGVNYFEDQGRGDGPVKVPQIDSLKDSNPAKLQKFNLQLTLITAIGFPTDVPSNFFDIVGHDLLSKIDPSMKRQSDEKVVDFDCYVFSQQLNGNTQTLWIGKQDFLIHQTKLLLIKDAKILEMERDSMEKLKRKIPDLPKTSMNESTYSISTENHTHIVINQKFVPSDFGF